MSKQLSKSCGRTSVARWAGERLACIGDGVFDTEIRSCLRYSLSTELYSKDTHFLLELIQNADDNTYLEGIQPTLNVSLESDWLVIECNEVGFSEANVRALCKSGASTKNDRKGYIGTSRQIIIVFASSSS